MAPLKRRLSFTTIQSELQGDFGSMDLSELRHNQIDTILFDLNLPDVDDTRPARIIRKNHILVPIIIIWCNSGIEEKITALRAGAAGYLTKPL